MLVSLKWLREYVDVPADVDVDDLAHRLTMASAEVEGIHRHGAHWDRDLIRVGEVLEVNQHPDADRLRLATVNYGGDEPQTVVCGAPNLAVGQRIAFAREGATVFDGHTGKQAVLKKSKIRGVESSGMVLSERELGLSDQHEGIIELPSDAPVGAPLVDYLGDVVIDVHVWPNRADMMSMTGIAREVAALLGTQVRMPSTDYPTSDAPASEAISVRIDDPDLCARYVATVIEGVTVGPSPAWMQERLRAAGQRPISNVVDITNYVMLELGQPLHAFDLNTLQGEVGVRVARPGETLRTLDGVDRELAPDTLLITDERGPIALAGVMGGEHTEVTEQTTRILLEKKRAVGVEFQHQGELKQLRANREVLLCAGALQSPQILMLSGIGPGADLQALGIEVVADLPGVGQNLQDHPSIGLSARDPSRSSMALNARTVPRLGLAALRYALARSGPFSSNAAEAGGFIRTLPGLERPDVQLTFVVGMKGRADILPSEHGFILHANVARPNARGQRVEPLSVAEARA